MIGLVEAAIVPVLVEGAHAVHASRVCRMRGEDPAPVAEDRAELRARDQCADRPRPRRQRRHDVPGVGALQDAQEALGQPALLVRLERVVVVRALVDHGHQLAVDHVDIGRSSRRGSRARRGLVASAMAALRRRLHRSWRAVPRSRSIRRWRSVLMRRCLRLMRALLSRHRQGLARRRVARLERSRERYGRTSMSEQLVFQPSAAAIARTLTSPGRSMTRCMRARSAIPTASGPSRPSASTGSSSRPGSRTPASPTPTSRSNGTRTGFSTSPPIASTGIWRRAATRPRSSGKATPPAPTARSPIASCTSASAAIANVLKANGVKKGDRVTIYMPMVIDTAVAMLACSRIGAVHSVIFGGFSPDSIAGRINDCDSHDRPHRR